MSTSSPVIVSRIQNRRGTQAEFNALYPPGYSGVGGATGTKILQPGEIGLTTDTRRVFIGNLNGEYIELTGAGGGGGGINFTPVVASLPTTSVFTEVPELSYSATSLFNITYSVTNAGDSQPGSPGVSFSRTGTLTVAAILNQSGAGSATLTDDSLELDPSNSADISFIAEYDQPTGLVKIKYRHNYLSPLILTTGTMAWAPF